MRTDSKSQCSDCVSGLQALSVQAKALQRPANGLPGLHTVVSPHRSPVPPQQLGKLRRALETQEEGILQCQQQLALLSVATASS